MIVGGQRGGVKGWEYVLIAVKRAAHQLVNHLWLSRQRRFTQLNSKRRASPKHDCKRPLIKADCLCDRQAAMGMDATSSKDASG